MKSSKATNLYLEMIVLTKFIVIIVLIMALPILLLSCSIDNTPESDPASSTSHETAEPSINTPNAGIELPPATTAEITSPSETPPSDANGAPSDTGTMAGFVMKPYEHIEDEVYWYAVRVGFTLAENQFNKEEIHTYDFDSAVVFTGAKDIAARIMEEGKNPGLGVRDLHAQGITGKGVNVAIIDQNLLGDHPEYINRIAVYYDSGCETPENEGSYHAPSRTWIYVLNVFTNSPSTPE